MESATDQTILRAEVREVAFGFYSNDEIRNLSVKQITSRVSFDSLNNPVIGGLYDPALGPVDYDVLCPTCHQTQKECPGHLGHIELPVPVYNPVLFSQMLNLLKRKCFTCHKFRTASARSRVLRVKILLLDNGFHDEAAMLSELLEQRNGVEDEPPARTFQRQQAILDEYERLALSAVKEQKKNDRLKPLPRVAEVQRNKLCAEFMKGMKNKCENCGAISPGIRQDASAKIFLKPLSARSRKVNRQKNLTVSSALDTINGNVSDHDKDEGDDSDSDEDMEDDSKFANAEDSTSGSKFLPPLEVQSQLQMMWRSEDGLMELLYGDRNVANGRIRGAKPEGWKKFFLSVVPVAPSRFRPPVFMGGQMFEHAQNTALSKILTMSESIVQTDNYKPQKQKSSDDEEDDEDSEQEVAVNLARKLALWTELQSAVNGLVDSTKVRDGPPGIKQVIEKKEGLFRKHMMGKRVNYAARSVISPDPYISTSQIGVPLRFAKTLTYPQPVTPWNVEEMRQLVMNGPDIHPGANYVESETGRLIDLRKRTPHQREAISKTLLTRSASAQGTSKNRVKRVWRHLQTGDVVLMNRQPTLHKPSMMAHVTRVLTNPKMQTIRMHYANCNTFNADFDGDEMNMHFPQNELARSEAYNIAANDYQYLVPTDGSPLRGLIQDHVDSGVKLSQRDTFLTKDMYMQLLFNAWASMEDMGISVDRTHIETVAPAMLKPQMLWTGKQVITSVLKLLTKGLPQLNLNSKAKIKGDLYGNLNGEHIVIFRDGELLQGVLDKSQFGASMHGMVHACYEIYGARIAADLLTALGRLFTCYLQFAGHTCALEDLTLNRPAEKRRRKLVQDSEINGEEAYAEFAGLTDLLEKKREEEAVNGGKKRRMNDEERAAIQERMRELLCGPDAAANAAALDAHMMGCVHGSNSDIIKTCLPSGQAKSFPANSFSLMVLTGAKGSMVNHSQISCGLGQQALEGRRVPILCSGRSLPSYEPFDPAPRAGGYITDRFLTGLRPQEYYHHCMAGREGLVDTAVKTSRSGYLQRCLMKHMEDLQVGYDHTVRNCEGNVVQFMYGEDGVDPMQSALLSGKDTEFSFQAMNHRSISHKYGINAQFFEKTKLDIMKPLKLHAEMRETKTNDYGNSSSVLRAGLRVLCRRLKPKEKKWKRGNIEQGWYQAEIIEVSERSEDGRDAKYDVQYLDTGLKAYGVPRTASFHVKRQDNQTKAMSGRVEIIRVAVEEPVMQQLPLNDHVGLVSERIQAKLEAYNSRNPSNCLEDASAKKKKKKSKKKSKEVEADSEIDRSVMQTKHAVSPDAFQLLVWVNYMRSMAAPGENVGVIAAQSVGEPSTQMTLNTFHLAGHGAANVTLGIPRLREIIMTASQKMSTPMMTIPLRDTVNQEKAKEVERRLNRVALSELLHHKQGVKVVDAFKPSENGVLWVREYTIQLTFYRMKEIARAFGLTGEDVYNTVAGSFIGKLLTLISREMKKSGDATSVASAAEIGSIATSAGGNRKKNDDDDDESDDEEQGTLRFGSRQEVRGYDEADEDERRMVQEQDDDDEDMDSGKKSKSKKTSSAPQNSDTENSSDEEMEESNGSGKKQFTSNGLESLNVPVSVRKKSCFVYCGANRKENFVELRLRFPTHSKTLLMVPLAEKVAQQVLVRHCPGISRCYMIKQRIGDAQDETPCLQTEGLNFEEIWGFDNILDVNQLMTNDIYKVLQTYGVEAARASISKQINDVFGVYGISVDYRHLSLIADYMTATGGYMPMNRIGMANKGSPFQQITFETSMKFLTEAALNGLNDDLESSSSRLVLGQPPRVGTGSFSLLQPIAL
ncbi:hypothetical protein Poli38472_005973 [Pythium oligandrum]|uniref:DNA-directed RNA polymerase subunit n=1 Tax=Pythium oligandrum TaxID=41045 RepID=A0A8K1FLQ6_PYTOL|nr:hypothetical protein Poli38472_005973 [Pythium oligandrum]|eukprot:TMW68505.1 hypothetical protein Poli38472_005973 [Pythium oligandrum]